MPHYLAHAMNEYNSSVTLVDGTNSIEMQIAVVSGSNIQREFMCIALC